MSNIRVYTIGHGRHSFDDFLALTGYLIEFARDRTPYVDCQIAQMDTTDEHGDPAAACVGIIAPAARRFR